MTEFASSPPKVCVVTEAPISRGNGFGVTLGTFFSGWPAENLLQMYARSDVEVETGHSGIRCGSHPGPPQAREHSICWD